MAYSIDFRRKILDLWQKEGNVKIKGSDSNRSKIDPSQISNG
jgi:hypothetical protein